MEQYITVAIDIEPRSYCSFASPHRRLPASKPSRRYPRDFHGLSCSNMKPSIDLTCHSLEYAQALVNHTGSEALRTQCRRKWRSYYVFNISSMNGVDCALL